MTRTEFTAEETEWLELAKAELREDVQYFCEMAEKFKTNGLDVKDEEAKAEAIRKILYSTECEKAWGALAKNASCAQDIRDVIYHAAIGSVDLQNSDHSHWGPKTDGIETQKKKIERIQKLTSELDKILGDQRFSWANSMLEKWAKESCEKSVPGFKGVLNSVMLLGCFKRSCRTLSVAARDFKQTDCRSILLNVLSGPNVKTSTLLGEMIELINEQIFNLPLREPVVGPLVQALTGIDAASAVEAVKKKRETKLRIIWFRYRDSSEF